MLDVYLRGAPYSAVLCSSNPSRTIWFPWSLVSVGQSFRGVVEC